MTNSAISTRLDSIIIATEQPARLADWYSNVLNATRESDNVVRHDDLQIILFPHDAVTGTNQQPERLMVNFHIDDPVAFTAHATDANVTWKRRFEPEDFGVMATLEDPDGNYVQFLKLTDPPD